MLVVVVVVVLLWTCPRPMVAARVVAVVLVAVVLVVFLVVGPLWIRLARLLFSLSHACVDGISRWGGRE